MGQRGRATKTRAPADQLPGSSTHGPYESRLSPGSSAFRDRDARDAEPSMDHGLGPAEHVKQQISLLGAEVRSVSTYDRRAASIIC